MKKVNKAHRCNWLLKKIIVACKANTLTRKIQGKQPDPWIDNRVNGVPQFVADGKEWDYIYQELRAHIPGLTRQGVRDVMDYYGSRVNHFHDRFIKGAGK